MHVAATINEIVAAIDALRRLLNGVEVRSVYNASLYPLPIEQESEKIAARYIAAILRIDERDYKHTVEKETSSLSRMCSWRLQETSER